MTRLDLDTHSFIWSIANITLARLIMNMRRESDRICNNKNNGNGGSDDGYDFDAMDHTELPVLRRECSGYGGESDLPLVVVGNKAVF